MKFLMKLLARAALNRPDAVLVRASGGVPRVAGGRTMNPRFQFIEAKSRKQPAPAVMTPAIARARTDQMVYLFGGKPERGVRWESVGIPAQGRSIPARAYRPVDQDAAAPLVVFLHFGGGVVGNLETCHAFCTILAKQTRGPVLSVEYRLAPEHRWPAGLDDSRDAYVWGVQNADRFGAPKGRAALGGDSMGGNFTAIIAQDMKRAGGPAPLVQLLIYPATDIADQSPSMTVYGDAFPLTAQTMAWFMSNYLPEGADSNDPRLSPMRETGLSGLPQALVYTAGFDPLADQGKAYADRLKAAGVRTALRRFDALVHGFTAFTGAIPAADAACREIARELAAVLHVA